MMNGALLQQEEINANVRNWSESNQRVGGDSLPRDYVSKYTESTYVSFRQNNLDELKEIWEGLDRESCQIFFSTYGDIAYLFCFTLNGKYLMPTVEEYTELLRVPNTKGDWVYTKPERGTNSAYASRIWQEEVSNPHKKAQLLAVAIYGFVIFPRIISYIDVAILDLFNQLEHGINPVPATLAETFIYLNACRELEGGRFKGCAPLLMNSGMKWTQVNGLRPSGICKSKTLFGGPHGYALGVFYIGEFKKKVNKIYLSWKHCYRVKSSGSEDNMVTPDYVVWMQIRVNDTILLPDQGQTMSMEEHMRVIPSETDTLRNELEANRLKMEEIEVQHERDLYLARIEVDKFAREAEQAMKKYSKLKIEYNIHNAEFKKLEASVKHIELRKTPAEWRQEIQQAEDRQKSWAEREIEKERKRNHELMESEKEKGKQTIEQNQQALKAEKDNTAAWKRKSHDNKIRLTESQNAYNALEI
ncbi:hypothetical protein V6N13_072024 [Hibiscus sabdariffa]